MKFHVQKLEIVEQEILQLNKEQQEFLNDDYSKIENSGIEFVKVRPIQDKIFEIKSNEIRSLFKYEKKSNNCYWSCFCKENAKNSKRKNKTCQKKVKRYFVNFLKRLVAGGSK